MHECVKIYAPSSASLRMMLFGRAKRRCGSERAEV
jgi:hypothetical protein